jgi:DnaK suppressor protein
MDSKHLEMFKHILETGRDEILGRGDDTLRTMTQARPSEVDVADKAAAEAQRSFSLLIRGREQRLLRKIEKALERIEHGEYGVCEACGGAIQLARLKARPVTTLCIECKNQQERGEAPTRETREERASQRYVRQDPRDARD